MEVQDKVCWSPNMLLFISIFLITWLKYELNFLDFSKWTPKFEKFSLVIISCNFLSLALPRSISLLIWGPNSLICHYKLNLYDESRMSTSRVCSFPLTRVDSSRSLLYTTPSSSCVTPFSPKTPSLELTATGVVAVNKQEAGTAKSKRGPPPPTGPSGLYDDKITRDRNLYCSDEFLCTSRRRTSARTALSLRDASTDYICRNCTLYGHRDEQCTQRVCDLSKSTDTTGKHWLPHDGTSASVVEEVPLRVPISCPTQELGVVPSSLDDTVNSSLGGRRVYEAFLG